MSEHCGGLNHGAAEHQCYSEATLGLATTEELIRELAARAEVSRIAGEAWPQYRTVDSE